MSGSIPRVSGVKSGGWDVAQAIKDYEYVASDDNSPNEPPDSPPHESAQKAKPSLSNDVPLP